MDAPTKPSGQEQTCVCCGQVKTLDLFGSYFAKGVRKYKLKCKDCLMAYQREYMAKKRALRDADKPKEPPTRLYDRHGNISAKRCKGCGEYKPLTEFNANSRSADKRTSYCCVCDKEKVRQWRLANVERSRATVKAYQEAHKDEVKARNDAWRSANMEHLREWASGYRAKNSSRIRAYARGWRVKHAASLGVGIDELWSIWYERYEGEARRAARAAATAMDVPAPPDVMRKVRALNKARTLLEWKVAKGGQERLREACKRWYWKDPDRSRELSRVQATAARRRKYPKGLFWAARAAERRKMVTPAWVSWPEMYALRAEARRRTRETGVPHELDHIYPIKSDWVCGLNTHHNIRVVPRLENRSKQNLALVELAHEHGITDPSKLYPRPEQYA